MVDAEVKRMQATEKDREREFEQRQKDREANRAARAKAAENARKAKADKRRQRNLFADGPCAFCENPHHYPFTIEERDRHLAHGGFIGSEMNGNGAQSS